MARVFVIGDIHGACRALRQCLERAAFDYDNDHLICLGDVTDGWPETRAAVEELLQIRNLTYLLGNHDWWTLQWMLSGDVEPVWHAQGGKATLASYAEGVPEAHVNFFSNAKLYHIYDNRLFVHAGLNPLVPVERQDKDVLLWDRTLASLVLELRASGAEGKISPFDEIYLGHTPISDPMPICALGVWLMDTGAGWTGVLSMMNVHSKEMFISDTVPSLYPGVEGRKKKG